MAKAGVRTECSPMEWSTLLLLIDKLKKQKQYQFLLLITIGAYCGLRISDILNLKWIDIIDTTVLKVQEIKTGKYRLITLNENLIELCNLCYSQMVPEIHRNQQNNSKIFVNRHSGMLSRQYVNRKLSELFHQSNIKLSNYSSHVLRKTFGKRVYQMNNESEASLILLSSIFNHSSIQITRRYIGLSASQIKDVYLNL